MDGKKSASRAHSPVCQRKSRKLLSASSNTGAFHLGPLSLCRPLRFRLTSSITFITTLDTAFAMPRVNRELTPVSNISHPYRQNPASGSGSGSGCGSGSKQTSNPSVKKSHPFSPKNPSPLRNVLAKALHPKQEAKLLRDSQKRGEFLCRPKIQAKTSKNSISSG